MRCCFVTLLVLANQHRKHCGQQHEDKGLDKTDEQLHEIKRDRQEPAQARRQRRHGFEHVFAGKDVAVETEAEGDGAEEDRNDFQTTDGKEDDDHQHLEQAGSFAFGREQLTEEAEGAES